MDNNHTTTITITKDTAPSGSESPFLGADPDHRMDEWLFMEEYAEDIPEDLKLDMDEEGDNEEDAPETGGRNKESSASEYTSDSVRQYLREIGGVPFLTAQEEVQLGMKVKYGTPEEKKSAINELTERNLKYVVTIAKRYIYSGISLEDLIQDGNIGLMKAAERYDPESGYRFTTYATWWIRQNITRGIADKGHTIRLPVHLLEKLSGIKRFMAECEREGKDVSESDIAKQFGMSITQVRDVISFSQTVVSLDVPIGEEGSDTLGEFVADSRCQNPEEETINADLRESIYEAMGCLTDREKYIIEKRFGLKDGHPRTLEELGKELGVTRERIRQIEAKALRKLKNPRRSKKLSQYLLMS